MNQVGQVNLKDCYLSRKDSSLQGGDIQVVKPCKCGLRGPTSRFTKMSEMDTPLEHAQDEAFNKSTLRLEDCNVSNRDPSRALSTVGKSQGGTVQGCRELIILAPRKN